MRLNRCCACNGHFDASETRQHSQISGAHDLWLCDLCAKQEAQLCKVTNNHPELLKRYQANRLNWKEITT